MQEDTNPPDELQLDDVVAMETDDLTDEHKDFLEEHKTQLTTDQVTKFGLDKEPEGEEEGEEKEGEEGEEGEEKDKDEELDPEKIKIGVKRKVPTKKKTATEEEEIDPDDEKTIGKIVEQKTSGITKRLQTQADAQAIDAVIAENSEYKKYRSVALKYMKHPSYSNIPAHRIMAMLSVTDQQKIGARKEREVAEKVRKTKSGGSTVRKPGAGAKDWSRASEKEVESQIARAKGQRI